MSSRLVRRVRQPVFCEPLEGRTLLSDTPILLHEIVSTKRIGSFHGSLLNGDAFTVQLKTGVADIYSTDNRLQLIVSGTTAKSNLTVQGTVQFANVTVDGSLNNFQAKNVNLAGIMAIAGSVNHLTLRSDSGTLSINGSVNNLKVGGVIGTIVAGGTIKTIQTGALLNATIASGTTLGITSGFFSDVPVPASPYGAGEIGSLTIRGPVLNSNVAVGADPGLDNVFGSLDDVSAGGGELAKLVVDNGADTTSHFEAGSFGMVKLGVLNSLAPAKRLLDPLSDPHFKLLA